MLRVLEGREGERRKKEKGEKKKRKGKGGEEERKRKKREMSVGFAATVRSACRGFSGKRHAQNEKEQRDETVIGTGVGMADRRKRFRDVGSSNGKRFWERFELNDEKSFENYF